jgi:hypothetical protein
LFSLARRAVCSAERSLLRVAEGRSGRNPTPALLRISAILPCGASGVAGVPSPCTTFLLDDFSYPSFFTHRGVVFWGRRRGQEVGLAERAERELATGAADLLSAGHSPHPLACMQAPFLPVSLGRRPTTLLAHRRRASCTALRRYSSRRVSADQLQYTSTPFTHA